MSEIALRELRNNAAGVLRRAQAGEQIVITSRGKPVVTLLSKQLIEAMRRPLPPTLRHIKAERPKARGAIATTNPDSLSRPSARSTSPSATSSWPGRSAGTVGIG